MTADFQMFDLHPQVLQAINDLEYETPTPIQERAIPALLQGQDVLGQAQTGTGKTAAFALPMLHALEPGTAGIQGLVVAPTRELVIQVARAIHQYGHYRGVRVLAVYGGQSYDRQIIRLERGVDIVVGTPGRMLDLIRKGVLDLSQVRYLVLDEADEMLSMGFIEDVEAILSQTPETRQTALFSATLPQPIRHLADRYMRQPQSIMISPKRLTVAETEQRYYLVNEADKLAALTRLLEMEAVTSALIFTRTKLKAAELEQTLLARSVRAEALHGDLNQSAREAVMARFRQGQINILVATDVAARGLDIEGISHVINFDIPMDPEAYVHRIGRTGRAGRTGVAITLLAPYELRGLQRIEAYTMQPIVRAKLPTAEEILARREAQFLEKMREELGRTAPENGQDPVAKLCAEGYTPEAVAAAAIRLVRSGERHRPIEPVGEIQSRSPRTAAGPQRRNSREPYARTGDPRREPRPERPRNTEREAGMVRFTLNVGKTHGIRPGDVVGAIASEAGIPGRAIGAIDIQQQRTLVDVAEAHAEKVQRKLQRCWIRGHAITISRSE